MSGSENVNPNPQQQSQPQTPKQKEKKIFKYFNGFEEVYEDPFEIDWRFQQASSMLPNFETIDNWLDLPKDEDGNMLPVSEIEPAKLKMYNDACHSYIPLIIKAFDLKPFDKKTGEGMTGEDALNLWASYLEWQNNVKKNTE